MKSFVLIGVVFLQLSWSYANHYSNGVGAFSYEDSSGRRYGGTYGLKDGEVVDTKGSFPPDFSPPTDFLPPKFDDLDDFTGFTEHYFRNLDNFLQDSGSTYFPQTPRMPLYMPTPTFNPFPTHGPIFNNRFGGPVFPNIPNYNNFNNNFNRAFQSNLDNQKIAFDAANKAFDFTSSQFTRNSNPSRISPAYYDYSPFSEGGFPDGPQFPDEFPFGKHGMPGNQNDASNSAYAEASAGPGYNHQVAAINPGNPNSPNINRMGPGSIGGGFKSVSASSYSSSSDINGQKSASRGAKTVVNDNGKITTHVVRSP